MLLLALKYLSLRRRGMELSPPSTIALGGISELVGVWQKKLQKRVFGIRLLMRKGGQTRGDANGDPDAREYYERIPSNRVQ
jgi:hypothetical protein